MQSSIPAGDFGAWLEQIRTALRGDGGSTVPCGDCVGCCTSSWFIPIRPNETATLALIPAAVLSSASQQASGNRLMGYEPNGHCPMFRDGGCSIYLHRPQTCKDFDCRVFTAAGIDAGGDNRTKINDRVKSWVFSYPGDADRRAAAAVRSAARFLQDNAGLFPAGFAPRSQSAIAVLAIKCFEVFLRDDTSQLESADVARAVVSACQEFDRLPT